MRSGILQFSLFFLFRTGSEGTKTAVPLHVEYPQAGEYQQQTRLSRSGQKQIDYIYERRRGSIPAYILIKNIICYYSCCS